MEPWKFQVVSSEEWTSIFVVITTWVQGDYISHYGTDKQIQSITECSETGSILVVYHRLSTLSGGGFKYLLFSPLLGEDFQFD